MFASLVVGEAADGASAVDAINRLGPDPLDGLPTLAPLRAILAKRRAPIKAVLLDQALFAGAGRNGPTHRSPTNETRTAAEATVRVRSSSRDHPEARELIVRTFALSHSRTSLRGSASS